MVTETGAGVLLAALEELLALLYRLLMSTYSLWVASLINAFTASLFGNDDLACSSSAWRIASLCTSASFGALKAGSRPMGGV